MTRPFTSARFAIAIAFLCVSGCQLFKGRRIEDRLTYRQQAAEIRKIADFGADRDDVVRELKEAGIVGEFSRVSRSIYYCNLWNRKNNERWHLNIDLLFDGDGRFYATRPSGAAADIVPTEPTRTATNATRQVSRARHRSTGSTGAPAFPAAGSNRQPAPTRRGDEHRTPFSNENVR